MAHFQFVACPPGGTSVGGDATLASLAAALAGLGHTVAYGPPGAGITVLDGLAIGGIDPADPAWDDAIGLVRHPTALAGTDDKPRIQATERAVLPRLRRVVTPSALVGGRLTAAFGVPAERIAVLPPGAPDVPRAAGSGGCAILTVGACVPRKGHDVLLRALARLGDLDWTLTLAGSLTRDPAFAAALKDQAAPLAGRITFASEPTDAALDALWAGADLFALATHWEGYGTSVAEALRRGLPVAVTAGGAAAELMSPATGVVAPAGDSEQLSKGMRRMIFDSGLRRAIADAAWQAGQALPGWPDQARAFAALAGA